MRFFFILLILLSISFSVSAQDDSPASDCDLTTLSPLLDTAQDALAGDDAKAALEALSVVRNAIAQAQAACSQLTFTSEEYGQIAVIGPVEIPAGVYRASVTTDGYFIADVTLLDGECDDRNLFNLTEGEASNKAEAVFKSEGCTVLIETDNTREPWTLIFSRII